MPKGCSVLLRGDCCHLDAIPVSAVDTTAAGDSFLRRVPSPVIATFVFLAGRTFPRADCRGCSIRHCCRIHHRFPQGLHSCVAQLGRSDRHFKLKVLLFLYRFHIRSKASACASCRREAFSEYGGSCDYRYIRVQLQYRSRYPWRDRSGQRLPENFPFPSPASKRIFSPAKSKQFPW